MCNLPWREEPCLSHTFCLDTFSAVALVTFYCYEEACWPRCLVCSSRGSAHAHHGGECGSRQARQWGWQLTSDPQAGGRQTDRTFVTSKFTALWHTRLYIPRILPKYSTYWGPYFLTQDTTVISLNFVAFYVYTVPVMYVSNIRHFPDFLKLLCLLSFLCIFCFLRLNLEVFRSSVL